MLPCELIMFEDRFIVISYVFARHCFRLITALIDENEVDTVRRRGRTLPFLLEATTVGFEVRNQFGPRLGREDQHGRSHADATWDRFRRHRNAIEPVLEALYRPGPHLGPLLRIVRPF